VVGVIGALLVRRWFAARRLGFSPADLQPYAWPSRRRVWETLRNIIYSNSLAKTEEGRASR
jgi:hypothetical protein